VPLCISKTVRSEDDSLLACNALWYGEYLPNPYISQYFLGIPAFLLLKTHLPLKEISFSKYNKLGSASHSSEHARREIILWLFSVVSYIYIAASEEHIVSFFRVLP
jgi:hypothetical protein